jgi:hypothetical protein
MQVTYNTASTPGSRNEDLVIAGPTWVFVLDGATTRADVDTGCVHDVAWLVRCLGGELASHLAREAEVPLMSILAEAISATCDAHAGTCDLSNPDSPSATVAMLRQRRNIVEWLSLADSPILIERNGRTQVHVDDRTAHLPSYTTEAVRAARNSPSGFWVASTKPEAAYQAVTGSVPAGEVQRAAVLSDGAARLADRFGLVSWEKLLDLLDKEGPGELIRQTRAAEAAETAEERSGRRGKQYDDATAAFVRFD